MNSLIEILNNILSAFSVILPALQTISLVISGVLLFFIANYFYKANPIKSKIEKKLDKYQITDAIKRKLDSSWKSISVKINSGNDNNALSAIEEAEKMLTEVLKLEGFIGKDNKERLSRVSSEKIENIEELIITQQKISTIIAGKENISMEEAQDLINVYEITFKKLKVISL